MFQCSLYTIRRVIKHQISADESHRDGLTKKKQYASFWKIQKIGAYATSHLKVMIKEDFEKIHLRASLYIS